MRKRVSDLQFADSASLGSIPCCNTRSNLATLPFFALCIITAPGVLWKRDIFLSEFSFAELSERTLAVVPIFHMPSVTSQCVRCS